MERKDVYKLIDGERDYQDSLQHHSAAHDESHSLSDWLLFIEHYMDKAKANLFYFQDGEAKAQIRKIAALCVVCMEHNETAPRKV